MVITGSGGRHFYFRHPGGDIRSSAGTIAKGIDLRGHNGYLVAPPSLHVSGRNYEWVNFDAPLADFPAWLIEQQQDTSKPITADNPIPKGQRNETMFKLASSLRAKGFDVEAIRAALASTNKTRCDPPLPDSEIDAIAEGVKKYVPQEQKSASEGLVVLENDEVDTIAFGFEKWSVDTCGIRHRFNSIDGWSIFNKKTGMCQRVPDDKEIEKYIRDFISLYVRFKKRKQQDDGTYKEIIAKPDRNHKTSGFIKNVMSYLRDFKNTGVHLLPAQSAPCSLSGAHDPRYIIALKNGLLDWSSYPYKLLPHTEDYYTFSYLPFEWHGEVDSELWMNYQLDATRSDLEICQLLQQFAGYCLMPHDRSQQKFLLIYGESGTGKSVYVDVLTALLGAENVSTVSLESFSDIHMVTDTYGKLLNICDESEEAVLDPVIENTLKHYTGGTKFQFKEIYGKPFSAYPTSKLIITTNHLPKFKDSSEGVWRRMLLVPFEYVIPEDKKILGFQDKIIATEMPAVLAWALEGARSLMNGGQFLVPDSVKQAVRDYKKEMFPEIGFLEEHFESSFSGLSVTCKVLRNYYEIWCKDGGYQPKNDKNLGKSVRKVFRNVERKQMRIGGIAQWVYDGLRLKTESPFYNSENVNAK
jgi:putative DNA primase/helicase